MNEKEVRWIVGEAFERFSKIQGAQGGPGWEAAKRVAYELRPVSDLPAEHTPVAAFRLPEPVVEVLEALNSVFNPEQVASLLVLDTDTVCDAMSYLDNPE